ncbi:SDR family oxidoreductase [Shewanella sp. NKUCC01_JLK]|uniref:UDP-glucose 4-epimerase family protein n=1 Tax=Shewanella sp. NKUCC01_JLK TaxID=2842123 RepID=UPI001C5A7877|nr:SDR family oxidoreductase [Shewanella sp. NKUCC01_JLK]MBW3514115.1 SDR family oxidoreductase [Shewanella sp. NKUCC01_JLK]
MILITGGSGFIGSYLISSLMNRSLLVCGRLKPPSIKAEKFISFDLSKDLLKVETLTNVQTVIHCAAYVHVMNDSSSDPLFKFRQINTQATVNLAKQAATAGVKRFIFLSSIKVNGESTESGIPFTSNYSAKPVDSYGLSKYEAELELMKISQYSGMEIVIIRPPLVYGVGVKANFASLMNLVSKGVPLPFGCITQNKRSLVSVTNLVDLIITCIDHPKAANQVFLVSDDHDVSTSEMVREMAKALDKPTWQLPIPIWCYQLVGKLFEKSDVVDRLTGSLQVDISHTKETLGWKPPQTLQEGFKQTAQAFLQAKTK